MSSSAVLNVYYYALYDAADSQTHSGLTANVCASAVRNDIERNYLKPRYVTVHRVPELVGVENGCTALIVPRHKAKQMVGNATEKDVNL